MVIQDQRIEGERSVGGGGEARAGWKEKARPNPSGVISTGKKKMGGHPTNSTSTGKGGIALFETETKERGIGGRETRTSITTLSKMQDRKEGRGRYSKQRR